MTGLPSHRLIKKLTLVGIIFVKGKHRFVEALVTPDQEPRSLKTDGA